MASFLAVAHRKQVLEARHAGAVASGHGRESAVRVPGDRVIYDPSRSEMDGGPVQAFAGHATVTAAAPYQKGRRPDFTALVRGAAFDAVTETPVRPFQEALDFVTDPADRGRRFRSGKFPIGAADNGRIARALPGGA
ncbi:hypothetical protein [Palleronia rufa]|uniref:hypothetical protein n=1 Tax=Palleronia rufa TaxID=1530186 RepID=UPI0006907109|nr:hypothetical protein [Palleronia rufa]